MAKKAKPGTTRKESGRGKAVERRSARRAAAPKASAPVSAKRNHIFPIVGVGASAGGLEAFTELLKALPITTGMAFVLIQHMDPTHESMLPQLLAKATSMPVLQVRDGLAVEPDHVYVIPPDAGMTVDHGILRLMARKLTAGKILPIDDFFRALAEDRKAAAIGVILSGTASDGTLGLTAIKAEGGITFAQDQNSARFPDMPLSAVAAGCVDFSLPPDKIAAELAQMGRHPYIRAIEEILPPQMVEGTDDSLRRICILLRTATGVDFHLYKPATIGRRVARRMALQKLTRREEYIRLLRENRAELDALYEDIFIHVTGFFRDVEALNALQHTVLPRILESHSGDEPIRVWVPGCSSGEEVYSIVMVLMEGLGDRSGQTRIQIFGTDISEHAITHARAGIYPESSMTSVSTDRRRRFFVKVESGYQIAKFVRDMCIFARHDVTKDPPFSKLDLISCRNVLIYLGPVLQKRVAETFHYALRPSGWLLLGKSESMSAYAHLFGMEDTKLRLFTRKQTAPQLHLAPLAEYVRPAKGMGASEPPLAFDVRREAERVLLDQYVPAAFVVDAELQIVHFQGKTSPYLAPATGQPSFHLLRMVRPELVVDLRTAMHEAKKQGVAIIRHGIRLKHNGAYRTVDLHVSPLKGRSAKDWDFLVVFREAEKAGVDAGGTKPPREKAKERDNRQVAQLKRALDAAYDQLKTLTEEYEATSEEMKAVNEEVVSSNEELQSTNEELETAKEELQSSNEELITLNDEMQNRNAELGQMTNDLSNLLIGMEIPIVILDADMRIRRFTPAAEKVLNLIATDVGRPFTNLAIPLDVTDWSELVAGVVERRRVVERDVQHGDGHWYGLRLRPYQTGEQKVDGILMALFDIDNTRRSLDETREARDFAVAMVETVREPVVVLDSELRVIKATSSYYRTFATTAGETEGREFLQLGYGQWNVPRLQQLLRDVLQTDTELSAFEVTGEFPRLGYRHLILNGRQIHRHGNRPALLALSIEDATERKQAEELLQQRDRVIQEATAQAIVSAGPDGKIIMANLRAAEMFGYSREELLDLPVEALLPEGLREAHAQRRAEYQANPQTRPMTAGKDLFGRRKDGSQFPVAIQLSHIETKGGTMAIDIITDLTERKEVENALRMSEERLSLAQEVAGIGVWEWDTRTDEGRYSREWGPLYGLASGAQVRSQAEWLAMIHPEDRGRLQETREHTLRTGEPYSTEYQVVWPDGSVHWLLGRGSVVADPDGKPLRMLGVTMDITGRKQSEEERQTLTARLAQAQEEERRRISLELHDDLTQRLAGLAMNLSSIGTEFPAASERLKKRLRSLQGEAVKAAETARHVAYELHPSDLEDLGLVAAARAYCEDFVRDGITVEFSSRNLPAAMNREVASCLYRVTQEGLRNVAKHAKTDRASVVLERRGDRIHLRVRDEGVGFPVDSLGAAGGLGILSMRERVRYVNGSFSIRSKPGEGTEITVEIPISGGAG